MNRLEPLNSWLTWPDRLGHASVTSAAERGPVGHTADRLSISRSHWAMRLDEDATEDLRAAFLAAALDISRVQLLE